MDNTDAGVPVKGPTIRLENGDEIIYIDHIKREDLCGTEERILRPPPCPQPPEGFDLINSSYAPKSYRMIFWSEINFLMYIKACGDGKRTTPPLTAQSMDLVFNPKYHGTYVIMRSYGTFMKCTLITARFSQNGEKISKTIAIMLHKEQDEENYLLFGKLVTDKWSTVMQALRSTNFSVDVIYRINSPVKTIIQKNEFFKACNTIPLTNDVFDHIISDVQEDGIDLLKTVESPEQSTQAKP